MVDRFSEWFNTLELTQFEKVRFLSGVLNGMIQTITEEVVEDDD